MINKAFPFSDNYYGYYTKITLDYYINNDIVSKLEYDLYSMTKLY